MLKREIINFIFVGILNTIFGYSIYALLIYLGLDYIWSVFLSTIFGIAFNYKSIGGFVFKERNKLSLIKFVLVYIVLFLLNITIIKFLKLNGFNDYMSGIFSIVLVSIVSFILNKLYVFRENYNEIN